MFDLEVWRCSGSISLFRNNNVYFNCPEHHPTIYCYQVIVTIKVRINFDDFCNIKFILIFKVYTSPKLNLVGYGTLLLVVDKKLNKFSGWIEINNERWIFLLQAALNVFYRTIVINNIVWYIPIYNQKISRSFSIMNMTNWGLDSVVRICKMEYFQYQFTHSGQCFWMGNLF